MQGVHCKLKLDMLVRVHALALSCRMQLGAALDALL